MVKMVSFMLLVLFLHSCTQFFKKVNSYKCKMVQQKYLINKKKGGIKEQSLDKIKRKVSLNIISS